MSALYVLVAYPYFKKQMEDFLYTQRHEKGVNFELYLDSGAFTAYNSGKTIELDNYCRFLEQLRVKPIRYFSLDVYGDSEKSERNYETMLARGFDPVPVFTTSDPLSTLDRYYKTSSIVGLGGLGLAKNRAAYLKWITNNNNKRQTHMLGVTQGKIIRTLKPTTCDSSTWISSAKFGTLYIYDFKGDIKIFKHSNMVDKILKEPEQQKNLYRLGFSTSDLNKSNTWKSKSHGSICCQITAASWVTMAQAYKEKFKTKLFLAFSSPGDGKLLFDAYANYLTNTGIRNG